MLCTAIIGGGTFLSNGGIWINCDNVYGLFWEKSGEAFTKEDLETLLKEKEKETRNLAIDRCLEELRKQCAEIGLNPKHYNNIKQKIKKLKVVDNKD